MASSDRSPIQAWRDALQETWFEIKREDRSPRYVISAWADVKPSTAGAWKRGECTPDLGTANRLARNAASEGYLQLASLGVDDSHRIAHVSESVPVTGTVHDNLRRLDRIECDVWDAAESGDRGALRKIASKLHEEADRIAAEATTDLNE